MFVNSDFSDLLKIFNDNRVKYLVIGGYAFIHYAEPRYTKDLDLWIQVDPKNATAVFQSLKAFGAPLENLAVNDFSEEGYFYQMGVPPIRLDIMMGIPGIKFDEAWQNRNEVDFDGLIVPFISKTDLITAKKATGRSEDMRDAELLEKE
jgi:hypothetical protein